MVPSKRLLSFANLLLLLLFLSPIPVRVHAQSESSYRLLQACFELDDDDPSTLQTIRSLLKEDGVDMNIREPSSGQTPLMGSVLRGKPNIVDLLLEAGADASIPEKDGYTPPHGAAFQGRTAVLQVLQRYGVVPNDAWHADGYLPFHRACWGKTERHAAFVAYMLEQRLVDDVNVPAKSNGRTCREMTKNPMTVQVLDLYSSSTGASGGGSIDQAASSDEL